MFLVEIDAQLPNSQRRFSPLHEGFVHANCLGVRDDNYARHRRWIDTRVAQWLMAALRSPISLSPILARALREGDDAHSRCMAGSRLLAEALERTQTCENGDVAAFVRKSPLLSLPVWMAMASSVLSHLEGQSGSGAITAVGANGVEIGVRVAGLHGWRTCAAPDLVPVGPLGPGQPLPAIGDSGVVDVLGLGGQLSPVRSVLDPAGCLQAPPGIELATPAVHLLGGRSAGIDLSLPSRAPVRLLMGVIDAVGEGGRLGPGVATVPNQLRAEIRTELAQVTLSTEIDGTPL
jgi:hypothetical protein